MKLKKPEEKLIDFYIEKFNNDERYSIADKIIKKLIRRFPENRQLDDVLVKVSVSNDMYSTNIFATFRLAKHIQSLNIDKEIRS